jgi:hypothetical protein
VHLFRVIQRLVQGRLKLEHAAADGRQCCGGAAIASEDCGGGGGGEGANLHPWPSDDAPRLATARCTLKRASQHDLPPVCESHGVAASHLVVCVLHDVVEPNFDVGRRAERGQKAHK